MATAKNSTTKKSGSSAKKGSGSRSASATKSSSKSSQGGNRSAAATTGGSKKSSGTSKTGASTSAGTSKKAGSKASTARSGTASKSGGSKTSTATKSGAAGKRTASGGAKQSKGTARSTGTKNTRSGKSSGNGKRASTGADSGTPAQKNKGGIISSVADAVTGIFRSGKPNAIDLLTADHRVVDEYFQKVKANEDRNHQSTFEKIQFELDAHAHIEETIFYPYLLEHGDKELKKIVREGIEEHRQVKLFLAELDELSGDNERFKAKLQVLMEDVEHHVEEEEDEMFPLVEDQVPREMLEKLGNQMEKEKARFQKRTTPSKTKRASAGR